MTATNGRERRPNATRTNNEARGNSWQADYLHENGSETKMNFLWHMLSKTLELLATLKLEQTSSSGSVGAFVSQILVSVYLG